jgi:GNAT superfamily N-acetyltransferase
MLRVPPAVARGVARALQAATERAGGRLMCERWARLSFPIGRAAAPEPEPAPSSCQIPLEPVTEEDIRRWDHHPDREAAQLCSARRFWRHGLRQGFVFRDGATTRCTVWVLTARDNRRLRRLPAWAGMYPPLRPGLGQMENLFVFSDARRTGVGSRFVRAIFAEASARGLTALFTHISERNGPACAHATRVGWRRYGTILRFTIDLPVLRALPMYVHLLDHAEPVNDAPESAVSVPTGETVSQHFSAGTGDKALHTSATPALRPPC